MAYSNIKDPSAHFQIKSWTGTGSAQSITFDGNSDLQADWIWHKEPPDTNGWHQTDTSIGLNKYVASDSNAISYTTTAYVTAAGTNSISYGAGDSSFNSNGQEQATWAWHCNGGTTSSNTDGTTTSTVQVNSDAGFSISTFSATNPGPTTFGHGLSQTPDFFMFKNISVGGGWWLHHSSLASNANSQYVGLHSTAAATNLSALSANATTITVSADFVGYATIAACYAFHSVQGYSSFGSYKGTGARDYAPFVYTGFKPAFVMVRCTNTTGQWLMFDNARNPFNGDFDYMRANNAGAEENSGLSFVDPIDFLSNGFKVLNYDAWMNGNNNTYIYMAFAENPFVAGGVPTTAR